MYEINVSTSGLTCVWFYVCVNSRRWLQLFRFYSRLTYRGTVPSLVRNSVSDPRRVADSSFSGWSKYVDDKFRHSISPYAEGICKFHTRLVVFFFFFCLGHLVRVCDKEPQWIFIGIFINRKKLRYNFSFIDILMIQLKNWILSEISNLLIKFFTWKNAVHTQEQRTYINDITHLCLRIRYKLKKMIKNIKLIKKIYKKKLKCKNISIKRTIEVSLFIMKV